MKFKQFFIVIVTLNFIFFASNNIYCGLHGNDVVEGYPEPEASTIESIVIEGASCFFQGMADIMNLFNDAEKCSKGGTFSNSIPLLDSAITKLTTSKEKYMQAIRISKAIDKSLCDFSYLEKFDYDSFVKDSTLDPEIAAEVKQYLSTGNVVGFYQKLNDEMDGVLKLLETLKEKLGTKTSFYQEDYWLILQHCSRLILFGNYGTVLGKTAYNSFK